MKLIRTQRTLSGRAGFSLLELIVVMAVISMLVGVSVPMTSTLLRSKARAAAYDEMSILGKAAEEHFRDTGSLPTSVNDLEVSSGAGWAGPYLTGTIDDRRTGLSGYRVDPWSNDYDWDVSGDVLTLTSSGSDGSMGTSRDIELEIDVTAIRRELTIRQLDQLRIVINAYNGLYLATDPLPADWATIVSKLTSAGLLPSSSGLTADAWGDDFVPDPLVAPVLNVTSANL